MIIDSYQMFETNMDEYLDEEVELVKRALEVICKDWEREVCFPLSLRLIAHYFSSIALDLGVS